MKYITFEDLPEEKQNTVLETIFNRKFKILGEYELYSKEEVENLSRKEAESNDYAQINSFYFTVEYKEI